jgi:Pyridoxamine 5'-phosphate oxidase
VRQDRDPAAQARAIIEANLYMVLATADGAGLPWATPVYYAPVAYRDFIWVSAPDARHSQNIQVRPDVGIVIFDSTVPISTGQGVYMSAVAREVDGDEVMDLLDVFSRRTVGHGGRPFTVADVGAASRLRLYTATALDHYVLEADVDRRMPVSP